MLENNEWAVKNGQFEKLERQKKTDQLKKNTICVGHHYAQTNTNNVNKT